jgi:tryptophan 2,3-dioxygenase
MTEQPEKKAPLIERLEAVPAYARLTIHDGHYSTSYYPVGAMAHEAAAELRRLHAVNAELLEALKAIVEAKSEFDESEARKIAQAAIAKTEEPKP